MSTVRFRYGFHPEGFDPLLALRATQPATAVQGATVIGRQDLTVPSTLVASPPALGEHPVLPCRIVRQERSRRGRGWGRFLWASLVLLSAGVAGTVWATGEGSTTGAETPALAFAAPTIIEPEILPSDQSDFVVTTDEPASSPAVQPPAVSYPTPRKSSPVPSTTVPSTTVPSTTVPSTTVPSTTVPPSSEPSQPSASRVPPALPSVSLPPAVVWTPASEPEKPSRPPVTTPETPTHRPDVAARPESKPTLRVPPVAQTRTPVSKPKARPASPVTAGNMTRATK